MSKKFIKAIKADEIAAGGMKVVELEEIEIIVCNCRGKYYAVQRRCGHMNAPLEKGTLDGIYLTCPMHCAQFDISNGEALSGPIPSDTGHEIPPPFFREYLQNIGLLMKDVRTEYIKTYETKLDEGWVQILL